MEVPVQGIQIFQPITVEHGSTLQYCYRRISLLPGISSSNRNPEYAYCEKNALLVNSTNRIHLIVEIAQCKALFAETQCLNWIPLLYMGLVGTPP